MSAVAHIREENAAENPASPGAGDASSPKDGAHRGDRVWLVAQSECILKEQRFKGQRGGRWGLDRLCLKSSAPL